MESESRDKSSGGEIEVRTPGWTDFLAHNLEIDAIGAL